MQDEFRTYSVKNPDKYLVNYKWNMTVGYVITMAVSSAIIMTMPYVSIPVIITLTYFFIKKWREGFNDEIKCIRINFKTGAFEIVVANDERVDGNLFDYRLKQKATRAATYYLYDPVDRKKFYIRWALQDYVELIKGLEVFYYRNKRRLRS